MEKAKLWLVRTDETWYYTFNKWPILFVGIFKWITHLGGARFTIGGLFILLLFGPLDLRTTVITALLSLTVSHLIVIVIKKWVRRLRPYLALPNANVYGYLFKDHSFPSGHSTAIFSVIIPFIIYNPVLTPTLLVLASLVAFSRVVLGVHYPSDIIVGALLGTITAFVFCS